MVGVVWVSNRVMAVMLVLKRAETVLWLGSIQCGKNFTEKMYFYDQLKNEWDMHSIDDIVG